MLKRTFRPQMETLEDRWVPATIRLISGTVFISNQVGALTITPQTGTSVQITDGATVKVVAGTNVFVTGTNLANTVTVDLGTSTYNGNMYFSLGNGNDTLNVTGANAILGNLTVQTGLGDDVVNIAQDGASTIGGNITLIDQLGNDSVTFSAAGGTAKFLGSITSTGVNFLNFFDSTVGGNVNVTLGNDNQQLVFFSFLGGPVNFNGNLNITGGAGNDDIEIDDAIIGGNVNLNLFEGNNQLLFSPTQVNGNFSWTSGGGNDLIVFNPAGTTMHGNATFNLGNGDNTLFALGANATLNGDLRVTAGNGNNTIAGGFGGTLAGDATFVLGNGNNAVDFTTGSIGGDINMFLGNGNNIVNVTDTVLGGTLRMRTGNGNNSLAITPAAASFFDADVRFGNGNDTFTLNANVTLAGYVNGGNGTDTFVQGGATLIPTLLLASFEA